MVLALVVAGDGAHKLRVDGQADYKLLVVSETEREREREGAGK